MQYSHCWFSPHFFSSVFSSRLNISQGGGIRNAACWQEVEKGQGICKRWPLFRQLFSARRTLELVELLPGTFTSWCTAGPLPIPPPETPALFCVKPQGAPQARSHQPRLHFFHIPICWGVNLREHTNTSSKNEKGHFFWHEKKIK